MKKFNFSKKAALAAVSLVTVFVLMTGGVHAIPYTGEDTPNSPVPAFNVYTGVPAPVGNESDFLRARVPVNGNPLDANTQYVDPLSASCVDGQVIQLRVYVHNGASEAGNNGGNGPSVAHDSKVKVDLDNDGTKATFNPSATISASNAATVTDGATISCNGKEVKVNYVNNSASAFSLSSGVVDVDDEDLFSTGALIRSNQVPGDVWGCWDARVYVVLSVKVEVPKQPPKPPVKPPVTPPTEELPNTGAGSMLGIFTGTTLAGAILHRKWMSRRDR